jgi:hypothetical protein
MRQKRSTPLILFTSPSESTCDHFLWGLVYMCLDSLQPAHDHSAAQVAIPAPQALRSLLLIVLPRLVLRLADAQPPTAVGALNTHDAHAWRGS